MSIREPSSHRRQCGLPCAVQLAPRAIDPSRGVIVAGPAAIGLAILVALAVMATNPAAAWSQSLAQFDVPAYLEARDLCERDNGSSDRAIEIVIPVSTWMNPPQRQRVSELRVEVGWVFDPLPVVDYVPRTAMQSDVSGVIAVEEHDEGGGRVQSGYVAPVAPLTLQGQIELSKKRSTTTRMAVIPPHELLVASGTVERGTGAFFRFHAAPRVSLEGSRDVMVVYRAPAAWRGGLLHVQCLVSSPRKSMMGPGEPRVERRTFTIPIFLQGDADAQRIARQYAEADGALAQAWSRYRGQLSATNSWLAGTPIDSSEAAGAPDWSRLDRWLRSQFGMNADSPQDTVPAELRQLAGFMSQARSELEALTSR